MKKILLSTIFISGKILWAVVCYLIALSLACISAYFTIIFYTDGTSNYDKYAMAAMAICLELIKILFATGYPFLRYRDMKTEKIVLTTMKICFILSILASCYYLMLGKDIVASPASRTVSMMYEFIPFIDIIPIKFSQFLSTISLIILVEFFIIFLPVVAITMFLPKDKNRKIVAVTNMDKIKEMVSTIPDRFIDRIHKKIMGNELIVNEISEPDRTKLLENCEIENKIKAPDSEMERNKEITEFKNTANNNDLADLHLLDRAEIDKTENTINTDVSDNNKVATPLQDMKVIDNDYVDYKNVLRAIYKYSNNNICPSVKEMIKFTGLKRNMVYEIKRKFEELGIIKTNGFETRILISVKKALRKLKNLKYKIEEKEKISN